MYALIREYKGLDAKTRETATKKANSELRPILTKTPGFVSYELIRPDNKDDMVTSISVFDTRTTSPLFCAAMPTLFPVAIQFWTFNVDVTRDFWDIL